MRAALLIGVCLSGLSTIGPASAAENFLPLGFGYSTGNMQPSQLTPRERAAMEQADVYESDIYQRQLHARQFDTRVHNFESDRNSNGTETEPNY